MLRNNLKHLFFALVLCCSSTWIYAQKFELGVLVGGSYYYGDIVNEIELQTVRGSAGAFIRYHVSDRIKLKAFGGYAYVTGGDSNSTSAWQKDRNLDFHSDVLEGSLQLEYCLIKDNMRGRRIRSPFIPYVFVGVGGFWFSPKTTINGSDVNLASFQTNGVKYEQYAVCVPLGIGFKYKLTQNFNVGLEFGLRYTTTTYLDDVEGMGKYKAASQYAYPNTILLADRTNYPRLEDGSTTFSTPGSYRGKLAVNDMYVIAGLTLSYRFGAGGGGGYGGRAIRCPRFY